MAAFDGAENEDRPEPDADFGEAEGSFFAGDQDVGVGGKARASGEGGAVNAGDEAFVQTVSDGEEALMEVVELSAVGLEGFGEVHAGAEAFAGCR